MAPNNISTIGFGRASVDQKTAEGAHVRPRLASKLARTGIVAAALGDIATTYLILRSPTRVEGNAVLRSLATYGVGVALAAFVAFCTVLVAISLFRQGWLADVASTYVLLAMGFSCINNGIAFTTNIAPLGLFFAHPGTIIAYGFPLAGLALGTVRAYRRTDTFPWTTVAAGWLVLLTSMLLLPLLFA